MLGVAWRRTRLAVPHCDVALVRLENISDRLCGAKARFFEPRDACGATRWTMSCRMHGGGQGIDPLLATTELKGNLAPPARAERKAEAPSAPRAPVSP